MRYLAVVFSAGGHLRHDGSVGVFRWRWLARLAAWWFKDTYDLIGYKTQIWPIYKSRPVRMFESPDNGDVPRAWTGFLSWTCRRCESIWNWDGHFAPRWYWSKKPCLDCVCEAKAQGHTPPKKEPKVTVSIGTPINPANEPDCPECANGMPHEQCRDGWKEVLRHNLKSHVADGSLPKWRPPCSTCASNCGQCASGHCGICGAKSNFSEALVHDPVMHAAYEATKCSKCDQYAAHFCVDNKSVGEEYLSKNSYPKGEKDVHGHVVNR